ncbi:MAG: shikimate kinase [Halopenitus sp.]
MEGRAAALGAGTILNALATGTGSAFAIDVETRATVELAADREDVHGEIAEATDAETALIEECVSLATARWGEGEGGTVRTDSDVPLAAGLKSSSAAANATVLATCDALGLTVGDDPQDPTVDLTRLEACRLGVEAARNAGVTVTGAFDDATASMLGGLTVTNNDEDELRYRDERSWDVLVWTPPERAYSADADVERCENVAPMAELVADLALDGEYATAMTVNGLAFSAALGFSAAPTVEAMPHVNGVSLSGTGPSVVAVAEPTDPAPDLDRVETLWDARPGVVRRTTTRTDGATILDS